MLSLCWIILFFCSLQKIILFIFVELLIFMQNMPPSNCGTAMQIDQIERERECGMAVTYCPCCRLIWTDAKLCLDVVEEWSKLLAATDDTPRYEPRTPHGPHGHEWPPGPSLPLFTPTSECTGTGSTGSTGMQVNRVLYCASCSSWLRKIRMALRWPTVQPFLPAKLPGLDISTRVCGLDLGTVQYARKTRNV